VRFSVPFSFFKYSFFIFCLLFLALGCHSLSDEILEISAQQRTILEQEDSIFQESDGNGNESPEITPSAQPTPVPEPPELTPTPVPEPPEPTPTPEPSVPEEKVPSPFFPIGVWLQSPGKASQYKDIGINTYIGLWKGPTETQLRDLENHGMNVITLQNDVGLNSSRNHLIKAWQQRDEPDNAQSNGQGGFGPCISPSNLITTYQDLKTKDDSRPVYLNFGRGVADINWVGRGSCTGDTDYYREASKAGDILSFDIYPVNNRQPLELVAQGVKNLIQWSGGKKIVWNFIETSQIRSGPRPNLHQIKAEVWMSLIHGSMGIAYFVHEFEPFTEAGIFKYPEIVDGVLKLNAQIQSLASVLNSPSLEGNLHVTSNTPIATMVKNDSGKTYIFAVGMRNTSGQVAFNLSIGSVAKVLGEERQISIQNGVFQDHFEGYEVHIYEINGTASVPPSDP